jgi:hypothetical protein
VKEAQAKSTAKTTSHPPIQTAQNLKKVTLAAHGLEEPCASFPDFCDNRQFHVIILKNF